MEDEMTPDERQLLLELARWVAEQEDNIARERGTTSNWSPRMKKLIENIRSN